MGEGGHTRICLTLMVIPLSLDALVSLLLSAAPAVLELLPLPPPFLDLSPLLSALPPPLPLAAGLESLDLAMMVICFVCLENRYVCEYGWGAVVAFVRRFELECLVRVESEETWL